MFELKALFTQPLQWQLWCCRIYWLRTLTHLFKKQVTIYVALIANHTVCCRTEVYLSSSWAMPHKSFFFLHPPPRLYFSNWLDFEEYQFQAGFAFALCKVLIQCQLHRLSLCSVPLRERNCTEITRHLLIFSAPDQVKGDSEDVFCLLWLYCRARHWRLN